jgi:hypothetical protein
MIELKNLTNVVIGKLGKLVHKQNGNITTTLTQILQKNMKKPTIACTTRIPMPNGQLNQSLGIVNFI